ncbi:uncharacterized protein LOC143853368 [Tasmannia lanceolata]|uniref:uncharacterized protein LOC143853368 n=1 Tax=Tasmannia lanceolata TaxID=3420 RepID=UPI0040641B14
MALRKCIPSSDASPRSIAPLKFSKKVHEKTQIAEPEINESPQVEANVDIDLREVYFLIMHFLSAGPCHRTYGQFWNELLEHQLLPRRYHAWYSRSGARSGDEDDNGFSFPLSYNKLVERYPHIEKDHLVKLLKQLILSNAPPLHGMVGGNAPNAADVPTLLGSGSFSLLESDRNREDNKASQLPGYLRWPHMQADQVRGLSLREIGGGFAKHHRGPSVRAACYAIAKPSTMVQKMQIIKKLRGHTNAVYCAIFDRSGRYVVTGSDDRLVKIWSMETAFCLSSCRGHEGDITDLAVSSNNALVASASNDFIIRVWRLPDGLPISVLRGHTGVVTAIAFSPRPSAVYQLLSSSDDGTCRIWDARSSQVSPRIYIPKPPDAVAGKINDPLPTTGQRGQILCCAYNANGTVFVTGSSDTYARVWNAVKFNPEDLEQPNHEMDVLSGHENDVNYVQFSGCAVASRSSTTDISKEENFPKFKNSWFTHDNIVTCSRDGSAIIWVPRSRRSHGKVGRWTRAYHLKVPPPPMPPQPPRGGPRQRFLPTPRGVNMIVWSLDNRFVLAAIMDCRICVWNAADGSLVHSLTGHSESTYVLDVHPFNPRIAMSAGYDGKTIVWDIWEGTPVRVYETERLKLVDGKFSPDGTSIVLSDEAGQIYILATGQGESQKDAKYEQFFLGDYRPLIHDTHGNVLDQETQLAPYRRNMQDLLCDLGMIPYTEPYQNMYQQRRLGALGIEWRPPSVKFAVGPSDNVHLGFPDYQGQPFVDLDRFNEPLPEFLDAMDWEHENEVQSDDTDSEYNVTEEYSSEGEHGILSTSSSGDPECSAEDSEADCSNRDGLRRSKRKKHKAEVELVTSSGRRVKRRNLDERDGTLSRRNRKRKSRHSRLASRRKSSKSKSMRPQRRAARNALNLFSQITVASDGEDDGSESDSLDSESILEDSNIEGNESDRSMQNVQQKRPKEKEVSLDECENVVKLPELHEPHTGAGKRRLVLKFPVRDSKKLISLENTKSVFNEQGDIAGTSANIPSETSNRNRKFSSSHEPAPSSSGVFDGIPSENCVSKIKERGQAENSEGYHDLSAGYRDNKIKWGEVKARTSKRLRLGDVPVTDIWASNVGIDNPNAIEDDVSGHLKSEDEYGMMPSHSENRTRGDNIEIKAFRNKQQLRHGTSEGLDGANDEEIASDSAHEIEQLSPNAHHEKSGAVSVKCNGRKTEASWHMNTVDKDWPSTSEYRGYSEPLEMNGMGTNHKNISIITSKSSADHSQEVRENTQPVTRKLRIRSKSIMVESQSPSSKQNSATLLDDQRGSGCDLMEESPTQMEHNPILGVLLEEEDGTSGPSLDHQDWNCGSGKSVSQFDQDSGPSILEDTKRLHSDSNGKRYNAVYKRSKSSRMHSEGETRAAKENTSPSNDYNLDWKAEIPEVMTDSIRRTRSMSTKVTTGEQDPATYNFRVREGHSSAETSNSIEKFTLKGREQLLCDEWKSSSRVTVGLRSARNRRGNYYHREQSPLDKRKTHHSVRKPSWLMLSEHEESYRYIPQHGDEVAYLRQGHHEYIQWCCSHESGPWRSIKGNLRAVEFCKVEGLDYSTLPGSGESCCKLTLEFTDHSSSVFGKNFKLTLPELIDFSDFLVERTRYDAAIKRNWTHRDKCQVWWRNENEEGGSWWVGRILSVKSKSPEFPDSPWERYIIQYKSDTSEQHLHSAWELHDPDSQWEHPHIDDQSRKELLFSFSKIEQTSYKNKDYYGIQKLKHISQKSDFLNRFPVPLSLEVIIRRLENNYYRSLEAVKHDTTVMLTNAQSYFAKNAELATKMRRLSDLIARKLPELAPENVL